MKHCFTYFKIFFKMNENCERPVYKLRVFVGQKEPGQEKQKTLLSVTYSEDNKETNVFLPDQDDIGTTGWIPELGFEDSNSNKLTHITIRSNFEESRIHHQDVVQRPKNIVPQMTEAPEMRSVNRHSASDIDGDDILYRISFWNRDICVNGFRLSRVNFDSENHNVFSFIYKNAGRKLSLAEIEADIGQTIHKKLYDIIRNLGFTDRLKAIFFPHVSKTALVFTNPVSKTEFQRRGLSSPDIFF